MDEDHSNMQQPPSTAAPPASHGTPRSRTGPPSFTDTPASVGGVRDRGWSQSSPSVSIVAPAGFPISPSTARGGAESAGSVPGLEQGLGMMCVDFADLADVADVHQEVDAPEQVHVTTIPRPPTGGTLFFATRALPSH